MLVWMARLSENRRASASVLGVLFIMTTVWVVTFTIQVSDLYIIHLKVQRAADLATLAATVGATAPVVSAAGVANASATETALNVASLNGFGGSTVSTTGGLTGSTPTLTTTISNTPSQIMGAWMGPGSPVVAAPARALMTPVVVSDCIATLGGTFKISGTATVSAPGCGVASKTTIAMSGGSFTAGAAAVSVHAYDEIPLITGGTPSLGTGAFMYNAVTSDTAAGSAAFVALQNYLTLNPTWTYGTTIPQTATAQVVTAGTAQTYVGQTKEVLANTHWGALTLIGSTLNFDGSGAADPNCMSPTTISGATQLYGSNTLNFASGCYIFNGSVSTDYGGPSSITNFNAGAGVVFRFQGDINIYVGLGGSLNLGSAASYSFIGNIIQNNCSAYNTGSFTVGTGTKMFSGNITNYCGNTTFGDGDSYLNGTTITGGLNLSNNINFGKGKFYLWNGTISVIQNGNAFFDKGFYYFYNSKIVNATFGQGDIKFAGGEYNFYGGSITAGQNAYAYLWFTNGNLNLYNSTSVSVIGSGLRFGNGSTSSGSTTASLYGGSLTITAGSLALTGGTLVMNTGTFTMSGGQLNSTPPTNTTPNYGFTNIALFFTGTDINITGGHADVGGLIYAPNNTVAVSGSATLKQNGSRCLSLAANAVALSGSSSTSLSPCALLSATSTGIDSTLNQ